MEFNKIASVAGKSGLFLIVKPTKTGVILESIAEPKTRVVAGAHQRVSVLDEISVYTTDQEGSRALKGIFSKMQAEFGDDLGVEPNSDPNELKAFIKHVVPDFDEERVYTSDIKKLITWYKLLISYPGIFDDTEEKEVSKKKN